MRPFFSLFFHFFFSVRKLFYTVSGFGNFFLYFFCLISFSLSHQGADLFGDFIFLCS